MNGKVYVLPCGLYANVIGSEDPKKYIVEYEDGKVAEVNRWQCKFIDELTDHKDAEEFAKKRNYPL
jgi:hypothetical protein